MHCCRYVSQGDIFGFLVRSDTGLPSAPLAGSPQTLNPAPCDGPWEAVFFRVQAVTPCSVTPLLVDPCATELVLQGGVAHSLLPVGFLGYAATAAASGAAAACLPSNAAPSAAPAAAGGAAAAAAPSAAPALGEWASAVAHAAPGLAGVPGPLTGTWRRLARLLAPLLHPAAAHVDVAASVLLWGPRGSGRRTAARAAAAALGLHALEFNCHDLRVN